MAYRVAGHRIRLPRIPFFRVFYSLTYTLLYFITLLFLAITPIAMIYGAIQQDAIQYVVMIGGGYILTAIIAIVVYSGRLYTNRSVLSAVGKAYIPIEDGEIGSTIRKMIVKQLERSAIVAWESRPRDLYGEILLAEQDGILPPETKSVNRNDYEIGLEIRVDPQHPPWGDVQHPGWSSPSHTDDNKTPEVQYDSVIQELPHLIEAQAVSLAPADPTLNPDQPPTADPAVVEALRRPANMALREYLSQLSYLGLVNPPSVGHNFLTLYERARFSGQPVTTNAFNSLMAAFAEVLSGMGTLDDAIINEIRLQIGQRESIAAIGMPGPSTPERQAYGAPRTPSRRGYSPSSTAMSPVTAPEMLSSRNATPYEQQDTGSEESVGSVIHNTPENLERQYQNNFPSSPISSNLPSDAGSVIRHSLDNGLG